MDGRWRGEVEGVLGLLTGVDACFGVSVGGPLRVDDGGRAGVDVGVLDLKFVRDVGLGSCWAEEGVLLSLTSVLGGAPLEKEDGGGLLVGLVFGFVCAGLTAFEGGLVATEDGLGVVVGGAIVG